MITDQKTFDQHMKPYLAAIANFEMIFTFRWRIEKNDDSVEVRIHNK